MVVGCSRRKRRVYRGFGTLHPTTSQLTKHNAYEKYNCNFIFKR